MVALPAVEQIPIRQDEHGQLRVGQTRVLFELVIYAFQRGHTAEAITEQYPTLTLAEVYLTIGYYLRHQSELEAYLRKQEAQVLAIQREHEAQHPPKFTREMLLARRQQIKKSEV